MKKIIGKPISHIIMGSSDDKEIFQRATDIMIKEDTSFSVRFVTRMGSLRQFGSDSDHSNDSDGLDYHTPGNTPEFGATDGSFLGSPKDVSSYLSSPNFDTPETPCAPDKPRNWGSATGKSSSPSSHKSDSSDSYHSEFCIELEGQGLLIKKENRPSHTMWIVRPYVAMQPLNIALPEILVQSLGDGAHFLVSFLEELSDSILLAKDTVPAPPVELCRICERHVPKWWFERHCDICVVENTAETAVEQAQERLIEHRNIIASLISNIERQKEDINNRNTPPSTERIADITGTLSLENSKPIYRGLELPYPDRPSTPDSPPNSPGLSALAQRALFKSFNRSGSDIGSTSASGTSSPNSGKRSSRKILELLAELCEMAMEIKIPEVKYERTQQDEVVDEDIADGLHIRTVSPVSETRIHQVLDWGNITASDDPALNLLLEDTAKLTREKVESVIRMSSILVYGEKVRLEVEHFVQMTISDTVDKTIAQTEADQLLDSESESPMVKSDPLLEDPYTLILDTADETENDSAIMDNTVIIHDKDTQNNDDSIKDLKASENTQDDSGIFSSSYLHTDEVPGEPLRRASASAVSPTQLPLDSPTVPDASVFHSQSKEVPSNNGARNMHAQKSISSLKKDLVTPNSFLEITDSNVSPSFSNPVKSPTGSRRLSVSTNISLSPLNDFQRKPASYNESGSFSSTDNDEFSLSEGLADLDLNSPSHSGGNSSGAAVQRIRSRHSFGSAASPRAYSSSPLSSMQRHRLPLNTQTSNLGEPSSFSPASQYSGSPLMFPHEPDRPNHHYRRPSVAVDFSRAPVSPLLNASVPAPKPSAPSIKDYEIICPISKGAFGSVYLSRKKLTGEYFAIKVLKKADMIAKNQVMNVKSERAIMMAQADSPFVAKLFCTFQSKDYLFLVMEYLNGGDCAALIKVLGGLPEGWTQKYIAEVVVAVDELHKRGIVHRDLKPDNLLIDSKGHLKLIDFGLSRMGAVGRHTRVDRQRADSNSSAGTVYSAATKSFTTSSALEGDAANPSPPPGTNSGAVLSTQSGASSTGSGSNSSVALHDPSISLVPGYFSLAGTSSEKKKLLASHRAELSDINDDSASHVSSAGSSGQASPTMAVHSTTGSVSGGSTPTSHHGSITSHIVLFDPEDTTANKRFAGTPDYLAPETIRGFGQDETSDWWSLGCILFEFLYGYPPFHASSPNEVFQNILARNIQWPDPADLVGEDSDPIASEEAIDLINKLLCADPTLRLGCNGVQEIKNHAFFKGVTNWDSLWDDEASFIPVIENPENTDYFDSRGAVMEEFAKDADFDKAEAHNMLQNAAAGIDSSDEGSVGGSSHGTRSDSRQGSNDVNSPGKRERPARGALPLHIPPHVREGRSRRLSEPIPVNDFGTFAFKNLPVLDKANKEIIGKLKMESLEHQRESSRSGKSVNLRSSMASPLQSISSISTTSTPSTGSSRHSSPTRHISSSAQRLMPVISSTSSGSESPQKTTAGYMGGISGGPSLKPESIDEAGYFGSSWNDEGRADSVGSASDKNSSAGLAIMSSSPNDGGIPYSPRKTGWTTREAGGDIGEFRARKFSNVFDMSPSGSDNEDVGKGSSSSSNAALIRVQKRRAMSRKMSRSSMSSVRASSGESTGIDPKEARDNTVLDILVCDVNPVWRYSLERMLVKVGCRVVSVGVGQEAIRRASGDIKFDLIIVDAKLNDMDGADVARLIHNTMNANVETPIVILTALETLPEKLENIFSGFITRPPTEDKLVTVLTELYPGWRKKTKKRVRG